MFIKVYIAVPTSPPAEDCAGPPDGCVFIYFIISFREVLENIVLHLDFPRNDEFGYTGYAESYVLSAAVVH